ncbi:MAG: hypothetical protein SWY16_17450 [Cyanobacteriota bacterium]|nr:hypothetical protein [Cyanobacteriota bacterium]
MHTVFPDRSMSGIEGWQTHRLQVCRNDRVGNFTRTSLHDRCRISIRGDR